jgi:hypothetical protein
MAVTPLRRPSPNAGTRTSVPRAGTRLAHVAAGLAAAMAALYLAIFAGVLSVGRAEPGELGVLGMAGAVFAVIAALLWTVHRWWLWLAVGLLQLPIVAMYVAIAPERDPSFEVWGLTIRVLQAALVAVLVTLVARAFRERRPSS